MNMKIYDTMMFLNEVDLLSIRMNVLNDVVDYFVIVEANTTQTGIVRELLFPQYEHLFEKFKDKIIYYVCDNKNIEFESQWVREPYQKNQVIKAIANAEDDDIFMYSDLDEIPNPEKIIEIRNNFDKNVIYHFAQKMFNFYINYENVANKLLGEAGDFEFVDEKEWLGTRLCSVKKAREIGVYNLRIKDTLKQPSQRIDKGGWHFSYMGGYKASVKNRVKDKLKSFSHDEYNNPRLYCRIHLLRKIIFGRDFLGRDARFRKVPIDDSYPKWIREHYKEYPHLVLR